MASFCYEYPRPAVTVDVVLFANDAGVRKVLLIERKGEPFAGQCALPGGFLEMDEEIEAGARRELAEETGLHEVALLAPLGVYGKPGRDPRGRVISLAHVGVASVLEPIRGNDDARSAAWVALDRVPALAFDHAAILEAARAWLEAQTDLAAEARRLLGSSG